MWPVLQLVVSTVCGAAALVDTHTPAAPTTDHGLEPMGATIWRGYLDPPPWIGDVG
ncbi:hypothetical protein [Mycobacterium servetii]|uniref:Uncharacterized protein n=1 Tax=Mycobacterium servetii TaxID=3237418 RepID=A0ABV4BXR8_9MYCO